MSEKHSTETASAGQIIARERLVVFLNDIWPFNPLYPNGWRGEISVTVRLFGRDFTAMYFPAKRHNDWKKMDSANRFSVAPKWAKWFYFHGYYAGNHRNIYHLMIGHVAFKIVPAEGK